MTGRFWGAVVVVFLAFFVMDFVIHELILGGPYQASASLWRTKENMRQMMPFMWLGTLVMSFFFVLIFGKGYEGKGLGEGFRFGIYVGLMFGVPMGLGTYASMPIPSSIAAGWTVGTFVECVVAGLIAASIYRPTRA